MPQFPNGAGEAVAVADQPDVVPHDILNGLHVSLDKRRVGFGDQAAVIPEGQGLQRRRGRQGAGGQRGFHLVGGPAPPDQSLQQGSGSQAVGPVDAGATGFTHHVEILDVRASPGIHQYAAAEVVGRGYHRYGLCRDVDARIQTGGPDVGESFLDGRGRHSRGDVQQHVRVSVGFHLVVNRASHHVARGEVFPLGGIVGHEGPSLRGKQDSPFTPNGLADQKALRARSGQRGGMELNVLGVDDARACPVGHGQAVSAGSRGVGGVVKDPAQAARGQHRESRQVAVDPARPAIEQIGAVAGDGSVGGQRIPGVMGKSDEIHGREAGEKRDVGTAAQYRHQPFDDAQAGGVSHVDYPPARMGSLVSINQLTGIAAVERDSCLLHQNLLQQPGTLFRQKPGGLRRAGSGPGGDDVGGQGFRSVVQTLPHHPSLGPAGVGLLGILLASDDGYPAPGIAGQAEGCGGPGNAAADDQDIGGAGTAVIAAGGTWVFFGGCGHRQKISRGAASTAPVSGGSKSTTASEIPCAERDSGQRVTEKGECIGTTIGLSSPHFRPRCPGASRRARSR